jgi:hypothetical protein
MVTSQWIVLYLALAFDLDLPLLVTLYETLPAPAHVFAIGRRIAALALKAGLTKTISFAAIKYRRKYRLRQHGQTLLTYRLRLTVSHVEGFRAPGGGFFADFMINGDGLIFDLNVFGDGCNILSYNSDGKVTLPGSPLYITEWSRRLVKQFHQMNREHLILLGSSPQQLRDRLP